jgi:hypothetical protein
MGLRTTVGLWTFALLAGIPLAWSQQTSPGSGAGDSLLQPAAVQEVQRSSLANPRPSDGAIFAERCTMPPWPVALLCEEFATAQLGPPPAAGTAAARPERGMGPWQRADWVGAARSKSRFLIAVLPDPELTRLSLYFDRAVDSIQRAAESAGFYFDRHWIPWTSDPANSSRAVTAAGDEPGVLLFRSDAAPGEYLVVFLVGESPVSGIRRRQFLKATQYVQTIGDPKTLYVSGTSYSGALRSLRSAIGEVRGLGMGSAVPRFRVLSGSVTVLQEIEAFREGHEAEAEPISFASVMHNDTYARQNFLDYMQRRFGGPVASASLSEGQTAYGAGISTIEKEVSKQPAASQTHGEAAEAEIGIENDTREPIADGGRGLNIRFPREIARLRGAYPQPEMQGTPGAIVPRAGVEAELSVPIQEVLEGRDAVAVLSGAQLPVAQEAVLLDIANTLQRENIQLAGIAATDVFDSLFLAGFLRKATPGVRLYMDDTDLLYVRAGAQYSLDGILAITTYPLVTQNQYWSLGLRQNRWQQRSPASSRYELGMFNAVRALLMEQGREGATAFAATHESAAIVGTVVGSADAPSPGLVDHSFAGDGFTRKPPLWLVAVGLNGYWPVALLDRRADDEQQLPWGPATDRGSSPVLDLGHPDRVWTAVFAVLVILGGGFGFLTVGAQFPGVLRWLQALLGQTQPARESRLWNQFLVHATERGAAGRAYFLSAQCLALTAMLYPLGSPLWLLYLESESGGARYVSPGDWHVWAALASVVSCSLLLAGSVAPFVKLFAELRPMGYKPEGEGPLLGNQYMHLAVVTLIAFPIPLVLWWQGLSGQADYSLFFFSFRSLDLLNGVSPGTPFLLLGLGLMVMARLHGRRHAISLESPPELPRLPEDFQTRGLRENTDAVRYCLSNPITSDVASTLVILIPAFGILLLIPADRPQSLESWQYDWAYQITLRALFLFAALSWARFVLVWIKLHRVLDSLNLHPVRAAFSVLPSGYAHVPVFEGSGSLDSRFRLVRFVQDLRILACCKQTELLPCVEPEQIREVEQVVGRADGHYPRSVEHAWRKVAGVTSQLVNHLEPEWNKGHGVEEGKAIAREELPPEKRAFRIAEEMVAMPYVVFIGNAMLQLRNLLFYVTTSYFLGVVSALVYPFRGVQMIVWAATIGFIVLGAPVVVALVQMERDEILKRLSRGKSEHGTLPLLRRLAVFGALPILAILSSYFPGVSRYLISWLEPALKAF